MTPLVSQACGCWGLTSMCGTTRTDAAEARVNSLASWTTRGEDHPTARFSGPSPGTPPASSMPSISSSSPAMPQVRCVAASSKTRPVTAGARANPSTKSAILCAPRATGPPRVNKNASVRPSRQMRRISVSTSPTFTGQVRDVFHQATPAHGQHLATHLIQRLPACPIPEIAAWAGPYANGRTHSTPTSTQAEQATGQPKPSTDIIELGRRTARGYPNPTNNKLRMPLIAGGLDASTHTQL